MLSLIIIYLANALQIVIFVLQRLKMSNQADIQGGFDERNNGDDDL